MSSQATRRRLPTDERRRQLIDAGLRLLRSHGLDELSTEMIAREANVSKALIYHYFPGKREFGRELMRTSMQELAAATPPDPGLGLSDQLELILGGFLEIVEARAAGFAYVFRARGGDDRELQRMIDQGREMRIDAILSRLVVTAKEHELDPQSPLLRAAIQGWIFFLEGATLRWLERKDISREQLLELLKQSLISACQLAVNIAAASGRQVASERPRERSRGRSR